jgi:drug/metabolite transporter (DMT)-like permease
MAAATALKRLSSPYLLLTLTSLFWAGNFVVARGVQGTVPPLALAFWRWTIALCILLPFALPALRREHAAIARSWKILFLLGVIGVGGFNTLVYIGLGTTTATNALLLNSAIPVLIVLIGWLFLGQRVGALQSLGIALSMGGVAAIVLKGEVRGIAGLELSPGDLWVFAAMVDWAIYTVLLRRRPADVSPLSFLFATMVAGLAAITPFFLAEFAGGARPLLTTGSIAALGYIAVFASLLAYLLWNRAVAEVGGNRAGIFIHLMPVFGTLLAIFFLGESFRAYHAAGIALILLGIVLATRPGPAQSS